MLIYNEPMKQNALTKIISVTLAVSVVAPCASCTSHKKEYETVKADDKWYSCDSFEVSDLYPSDEYEYVDFNTVGATEESVYVFVDSMHKIEGSTADMEFDTALGSFMTCIDSRYVVLRSYSQSADGSTQSPRCTIYDSQLKKIESYEGSCYLSDNTLVLY